LSGGGDCLDTHPLRTFFAMPNVGLTTHQSRITVAIIILLSGSHYNVMKHRINCYKTVNKTTV